MKTAFDFTEFEKEFSSAPQGESHSEASGGGGGTTVPDVNHAWFWEPATTHQDLIGRYGNPFVIGSPCEHYWAARFAAETLIIYEPHSEQFYVYVSECGIWKWVTEDAVRNQIAEYLLGFSRTLDVPVLETGRTAKRLAFIIDLLRGISERRQPFTKAKGIVHLENGMLDLNIAPPVLRDFSPEYFSLCQSPVSFDPEAVCPRFFNELLYQALDPEDVELLRLMCGLFLLGRNYLQHVLLLVGIGGAGKGTIGRVIAGIIGRANIKQLRTKHLDGRFELDNLEQSSLLVGSDVAGDFLSQAGAKVIKALTGGDPLTMETKGGRKREIWCEHNVLINCNDRLRVKLDGDQSAWKRRLRIIEFSKAPAEKVVPDFEDILLRDEASGILNWMILGAVDVMKIVLNGGRLPLTKRQDQRVEDLLAESDSLRQFVANFIERDPSGSITVEEVQIGYENFCAGPGWVALNKNQFERQLGPLMMELHRAAKRNDIDRGGKQRRGFSGVRLRAPNAPEVQS